MSEPAAQRPAVQESWERVLQGGWKDAVLWGYACIAVAVVVWEFQHAALLVPFVMTVDDPVSGAAQAAGRALLLRYAYFALPVAIGVAIFALIRRRRGWPRLPIAFALLPIALIGLPFLSVRLFEYRFPLFTGVIVTGLALAAGYLTWTVARARALAPFDLAIDIGPRSAFFIVALGWLIFTLWTGALAHHRFIIFHPQPYDMSCETNAIHNLVHSGIPRISVCVHDWFPGQRLPANYASQHTPLIYYLYAPFYALHQDGRTLLWLQAAVMGAGAFGVSLLARRWLRSHALGALFGLGYLLHPSVQTVCNHDVHANVLAVPLVLLALGLMEAKRPYLALLLAFLTCICREETGVYGAAAGLYWALGSRERTRARIGWITVAMSVAILLVLTKVVMPLAGGKPRYEHFAFFFDDESITSILKSYLLNPLGALKLLTDPVRYECLWLAFLPFGFLALLGVRASWSLLIAMGLLLPATSHNFWVAGMNYGVPDIVPAVLMSIMGGRTFLLAMRRRTRVELLQRRLCLGVFVGVTAVSASILYGNVFAKSYKLEFGTPPYRQTNQDDYSNELGIVRELPAFGRRERLLWEVVRRVPDGPISTSWRINAQLANRPVAMVYPELGERHAPENLAKYVVLDRLPPMLEQPEESERLLREDRRFELIYENASGVIFRRKPEPKPESKPKP